MEFRSMYGLDDYTQADLLIYVQPACHLFFEQSVTPAAASNTDHCILPVGKAPHRQNTIAQQGRVQLAGWTEKKLFMYGLP